MASIHDDIIKWKHFPLYWPFVRGIHQSPVNSPHKGQWRGALMFYFICAGINGWVNNGEAGDLRRHRAHFDVIIMFTVNILQSIMMTSVNKTKLPHHADVIKWKKKSALLALCERNPLATDGFPSQRPALMFSLICAWTNRLPNNRDTGDLKRHCARYDVIVMIASGSYNRVYTGTVKIVCNQGQISRIMLTSVALKA